MRLPLLLLALLLGGCAAPAATVPGAGEPRAWPDDLMGPFDLAPVVPLALAGHDGIAIEAYLHAPEVPNGVRLPVVLFSTPYPGQCASNALACFPRGDDPATTTRIDAARLAAAGYGVVFANVRGTGNSGGCFTMGGLDEQLDQAALVEQLADAPWSNGRVGMIGHSYSSFTAWMGAVQAPPALRTIVVSGHMTDLYTAYHTPQGAAIATGGGFHAAYTASLGILPPLGSAPEHASVAHAPVLSESACPEAARGLAEPGRGVFVDERDETFWTERRLIDRIPDVTASVFIVSGFEDSANLHAHQDDEVWRALDAPKRGLYGHWGHDLPPPPEEIKGAPFGSDWYDDMLLPWLDHWLKGVGEAPRVGVADYADGAGGWRSSASWPPAEAREEVLYLADGALAPAPGGAPATLTLDRATPWSYIACTRTVHMFATEALESAIVLAGNAYAYLRIESDQPGGLLALDLYELPGAFECGDGTTPTAGAEWIAGGAADLRFHDGSGYRGKDFPVGAPTMVRIDFNNEAWTIEAGHRVGVYVTSTGSAGREGQPFVPTITFMTEGGAEASHLVLPLVEGTLGGAAPTLDYPPRPFVP